MFTTLDLSLNQYHHVFFQVEPDTSNVLTTYMYDNAMNSLGTIDVSFGTQSIVSALTSFDQNGANPYAIGVDHTGSTKVNMDLAFWGMYTSALKDRHRQTLMKFTNQTLLEPHSQATIHLITVTAGKFYVDGVQQAYLLQNPGYYVFDQRHASNANHPLLLSITANGSHGGGTEYTTGVVKNGIPGSLNAYTLIQVTENTPDLFYYCANHSNMGGTFTQVDTVYYVKVVQNVLGEYVYALSTSANGPYYNQMDLSFNAGETYTFDVSSPSNNGYTMVFGTEVDVSSTILTDADKVVRNGTPGSSGAYVVLLLQDYSGSSLVYFEDTSAGMGYTAIESEPDTLYTTNLKLHIDASQYNYTDGQTLNTTNAFINDISPAANTLDSIDGDVLFTNVSNRKAIEFRPNATRDGYDRLVYNVPSGTFPNAFTSFVVYEAETNSNPILYSRTNHNAPFHCNNSNTIQIRDYNSGWPGLTVAANTSGTIAIQTITYNPNLFQYTLGIDGETFDGTYNASSTNSLQGNDYNDTGQSKFYIGDRMNYQGEGYRFFNGKIFEFLIFSEANMDNDTKTSIQTYLSKKWITQNLVLPVETHTVTVSGDVFYIDGIANPYFSFISNTTYLFDISHNSNAGNTFVLGTVPDSSNRIIDYQTIVGTPGQAGAYTTFTASGETVFYYSFETPNMGYNPQPYVVKVESNVLGDPVFSIQKPGESEYYNQPDLSFSAPNVYMFDLSSSVTDGGYTLVFGTTVDTIGTVVESGYVTRESNNIVLNLESYTGNPLVYFENSNAGMGYVKYVDSTNTSSLIDLETEVVNDNYSMEDKTDVNGITKNSFHVSNKSVIPGPNSTTNLILNSSNGNGYMVYMFWAYVYDDGNSNVETVNGNTANIFNPGASFLGFSNRALCFLNGDIRNFKDYKASTAISAETWTHCAIVLEFSTGTFKAYYNGNEQSVTNNQYSGNTGDFYVQINTYSTTYNPNIPVYINDLHISNSASSFTEAENIIIGSLSNPAVVYDVTVAGGVFDLSGTPQLNVQFTADTKYIFDQSDPTNAGQTLVFGRNPDTTPLFTDGVTVMGEAGRAGAYTQLELSAGFTGDLYYFSDASANMGMLAQQQQQPIIADATNDWIGSSNQDDPQFTLANFLSFVQSKGITVTDSNISNFNAEQYTATYYTFPNGDKSFRFWASDSNICWLDFIAPFSGTCELKYGNSFDQTRIYVNDFTNYIDRIDNPTNSQQNSESKTHTFSVTQGDTIRLEEYGVSVSYFYHIKFTP